jgi:nucleotide-binding universal stress UspA family protein
MQLDAQLLLLHSIDAARTTRMTRRKKLHAHMMLHSRARKWARRGLSPEIVVRVGHYRDAISQSARDWDADLIILGSYRRRFGDSLVGTTAERVIRTANRPVLVVNRDRGGTYRNVLLASDLSNVSLDVARMTRDLRLLDGDTLSVVHAMTPATHSMLRLNGVSQSEIDNYTRQMVQRTSGEILRQLSEVGLKQRRVSVAVEQLPTEAIERVTERLDVDLVVVGASRLPSLKRIFLGSVSNDVLRRLTCDILLISPGAIRHVAERLRGDGGAYLEAGQVTHA